jgi:hypothetical protein
MISSGSLQAFSASLASGGVTNGGVTNSGVNPSRPIQQANAARSQTPQQNVAGPPPQGAMPSAPPSAGRPLPRGSLLDLSV